MKSPVLAALNKQRTIHEQRLAELRKEELDAHGRIQRLDAAIRVAQGELLQAITKAQEHQAHILDIEGAISREKDRLNQIAIYGSVVAVKA